MGKNDTNDFLIGLYGTKKVLKSNRSQASGSQMESNIQKIEEEITSKIEGIKPFLEEILKRLDKMDSILSTLKREVSNGIHAEENLLYTVDQIAQIITPFYGDKKTKPVSAATVRRWIATGMLTPAPDTHYRVSGIEIKRFIQQKFF